jgi:hypothetical protein
MEGRPDAPLLQRVKKSLEDPYARKLLAIPGEKVLAAIHTAGQIRLGLRLGAMGSPYQTQSATADGDGRLILYRISNDPDAKLPNPTSLESTISMIPTNMTIKLTPRAGAHGDVDGSSLTLASVLPVKPAELNSRPPYLADYQGSVFTLYPRESFWRFIFAYSGPLFAWGSEYTLLDRTGKPIQAVDTKGHSVGAEKLQDPVLGGTRIAPSGALKPKSAQDQDFYRAEFRMWISSFPPVPNAFMMITNVNPKEIASILVKPTRFETRKLGPFPTSPRS